jgi:adenylate kinase
LADWPGRNTSDGRPESTEMHVILMGAQGAGKGTQATRIAPQLGLVHLSTGALFREAMASGSELGNRVKETYDRGDLIPDDLTLTLVDARLNEIAAMDGVHGALFDGFPRTRAQAVGLDEMLGARNEELRAIIEIKVPLEVLINRLTGRRVCPNCGATYHLDHDPPKQPGICDRCGSALIQRADDHPEPIKRRLELYFEQTAPLLDYYRNRGLLIEIDGNRSMDEVTADIIGAVERIGSVA